MIGAEAARLPQVNSVGLSRRGLEAVCLAYVNLTESAGGSMEVEQLRGFLAEAGLDKFGFDELAESFDVSGDGSIDVRELLHGIASGFALHLSERLIAENRLHKQEITRLKLWGDAPLLSLGARARASVLGALDDASVLTDSVDMSVAGAGKSIGARKGRRWQAASDENGTAIQGEHWVEVDLGAPAVVAGVVLDWESRGYSDRYSILGRLNGNTEREDSRSHAGADAARAVGWRVMLNSSQVDLDPSNFPPHLLHYLPIARGWASRSALYYAAPGGGNGLVPVRGRRAPTRPRAPLTSAAALDCLLLCRTF